MVAYVQLGAGKINSIERDLQRVIRLLNEHENLYIVVGESLIGNRMDVSGERIRIIRDYPNSHSFNGFDFAIIAGGYNSYDEVIEFSLPIIFIPNTETGMDEQVPRVKSDSEFGASLTIIESNGDEIRNSISQMLDHEKRKQFRGCCSKLERPNGADDVSKVVMDSL